eukprot:jgi/Ulvmu1/7037/UM033_0096.1
MAKTLSISVMSLREYPADEESPGPFYIRAMVNDDTEVRTEKKSPKKSGDNVLFMEHLLVPYKTANKDVLKLELLLASPGGDLVLGECKMRVGDVVAAGAVHSWFPFIDAGEPTLKTGELLMAIQAKTGQGRRRSTDANGEPIVRGSSLPVPIAVGVAVILGFLSLAKTKRPIYYTVEEGDDLCTIGECFNQDYQRVFEKNRSVISNPNLIYPGDRLRIQ